MSFPSIRWMDSRWLMDSANFTNSIPVQFGSSTTFPAFGFGGTTLVSPNSSHFGSSTAPSTTKLFSFGVSFGLGSSTSASSEANTIPTTGFSFSGTSASITASDNKPPTGSSFSFTLPDANTSSSTSLPSSQPVFGNLNQMSMEDTMEVDTQATSVPSVQNFGQSPSITPSPSSGFVFGSTANPFLWRPAKSSGQATTEQNSFQFGNHQITASPENQYPFQASGSVDFNGRGGSVSLGSDCGEKAGRRIVRVKRNVRKK